MQFARDHQAVAAIVARTAENDEAFVLHAIRLQDHEIGGLARVLHQDRRRDGVSFDGCFVQKTHLLDG